jgi:Protein of unknown function (DUF2934)
MTSTTREKTTKKGTGKGAPAATEKRSAANPGVEKATAAATTPVPAKAAAAAPVAAAAPAAAPARPSNHEIAWVAYGLFLQSGGEHGRDLEHWYTAEMILSGKR